MPFSFGTRTVGESKLSSKVRLFIKGQNISLTPTSQVMFRYVGQLWSLYWYAWGLFFPILLVSLAGIGMTALVVGYEYLDARYDLASVLPSLGALGGGDGSGKGGRGLGRKRRSGKRRSEV